VPQNFPCMNFASLRIQPASSSAPMWCSLPAWWRVSLRRCRIHRGGPGAAAAWAEPVGGGFGSSYGSPQILRPHPRIRSKALINGSCFAATPHLQPAEIRCSGSPGKLRNQPSDRNRHPGAAVQRMAPRASRPGRTALDGNIVPEDVGQLRSISVAADPEGSQTHRRRRRTKPRCDSRPASGRYHLDVPRRSGDPG
jgi:hypothetical protein